LNGNGWIPRLPSLSFFHLRLCGLVVNVWLLVPLCLQVIRSYASNRTWVIGFLVDIFGALLMLRALSLAPVSGEGKKLTLNLKGFL